MDYSGIPASCAPVVYRHSSSPPPTSRFWWRDINKVSDGGHKADNNVNLFISAKAK
jgi:hypothetical protein